MLSRRVAEARDAKDEYVFPLRLGNGYDVAGPAVHGSLMMETLTR